MKKLIFFICACAQAGTWADLGSGTNFQTNACSNYGSTASCSSGACTSANYAFSSTCSNRIRAWNGGEIYANGTKLMIGMGGHQDYYGDEMASVNFTTNVTSNIYTPCFNFVSGSTPCASNADGVDVLATGAPNSRHLYYGLTCVDTLSTCYMFSTGLTYGAQPARYMWKFPYSGNSATSWTRTTEFSPGAANPLSTACAWDSGTGRNRIFCSIDNGRLWQYNTGSDTWTALVTAGLQMADGMTIHPRLDIAVQAGDQVANAGKGLTYIYLDNRDGYAVHDVTSVASATCGSLLTGKAPGLAYDPNDGMLVGKDQNSTTVYILNPQTWTCSTDNPSGAPTSTNTPQGVYGRWRYSKYLNKFVVLQDWDQNVFTYQRTYGVGSSTITCGDKDGDGYGVGQVALNPSADLVIASPGTPPSSPTTSVVGTTGSTTYYYFLSECRIAYGPVAGSQTSNAGCSIPSTGALIANGNATLNGSNYNHITWADTTGSDPHVIGYRLLRNSTSTLPSGTGNFWVLGVPSCATGTCTVDDQTNTLASITVAQSNSVTSASHPFTSADYGKTITVFNGTGFTKGSAYTILAVDSGVASLANVSGQFLGVAGATGGSWRYDGCTGPDSDDLDSAVHTGASFVSKWTTLKNGFLHQGYSPARFWWLDPSAGSDTLSCRDTNASTGAATPCATFAYIQAQGLAGGDMVIFRAGDYTEAMNVTVNGSTNTPIIFKSYPGEKPILRQQAGFGLLDKSWLIVDGLTFISQNATGNAFNGGSAEPSTATFHDNIFRNIELTNWSNGFYAFNGMTNITFEDNVSHDMHGSTGHCFYTGARGAPNAHLTYQRNLAFNCDYTGMQHNGRVTDMLMQQNIIYSTLAQCMSIEQGVSNSVIRGNLVFNCGNAGMVWAIYDQDARNGWGVKCPDDPVVSPGGLCNCDLNAAYCPHDETGNLIENNTFYQSGFNRNGSFAGNGAINYSTQNRAFIIGQVAGPYNTTVNNSLATVIDGVSRTFTLTAGASRTAAQVAAEINAVVPGAANGESGTLRLMSPAAPNTTSNLSVTLNATAAVFGLTNTAVPGVVQPIGFPRDLGNNTFRNNIFYASPGIAGSGPESAPPFEWNERQTAWLSTTSLEKNVFHSLANPDALVMGWGLCSGFPDYITCSAAGWPSLTCTQAATTGALFPNGTATDCKNVIPTFTSVNTSFYNLPLQYDFSLASGSPAIGVGSATNPAPSDLVGSRFFSPPSIGAREFTTPLCTITPTGFGPYTKSTSVGTVTFTANNCGAGTLTWTSSGLPAGLSGCNSVTGTTCAVTGTPSTATSYTPTISVSDGGSNNASINPTVVINDIPAITTTSLPGATQFVAYSQSLTVNPLGTAPTTCVIFSGTLSGSGITLNSNCTLTGTGGTPATYSFTAKATDSLGSVSAATPTINLVVTGVAISSTGTNSSTQIKNNSNIRN